jgi:hypothetical protein
MKKNTTKPASTKPAAKKPPAKKSSSSRPKRKAQGQSEFGQVLARLDTMMAKLNELLERVAQLTAPHATPAIEPMHPQPTDEHADDVEIGDIREE